MNSEMAVKRRGGTKSKTTERIYIFLHQQWKQCLESANIWLMLTIQTVMSVGYTVLLLSEKTKQENQCNEASRL